MNAPLLSFRYAPLLSLRYPSLETYCNTFADVKLHEVAFAYNTIDRRV